MQSRIIVLTLLILSIDKIICMRCYEGFNASVAGIPFYHWAERQCEGDSECMIQDVVFKDGNFGVSVRYGGCISSSYSSLATCEQLFGEESTVTLPKYYTLIASGDEKIRNFMVDFFQDRKTHEHLLFSRGKGREEFYSGVLRFLGNLGFDKEEIKAPLKRYLKQYLANSHAGKEFRALLNSMMVMNEATERLTEAYRKCLIPMYTSVQPDTEINMYFSLLRFFYPIVSLELNATDVYNTISEGFESTCGKDFISVLPEENIKPFLLSLNFFQLLGFELTTTNKSMVYDFSIHTIEVYMKAYPDSPIPKTAYRLAEGMKKLGEWLSLLHLGSKIAVNCASEDMKLEAMQSLLYLCSETAVKSASIKQPLMWQRSEVITNIIIEGIYSEDPSNFSTAWNNMRYAYLWSLMTVTNEDYNEITAAWSHWVEKFNPFQARLANLISDISRPVNNIAKKMDEDSRKKFRKGIVPHSCKHYFCASDLCNRHGILEALQPTLGTFSRKVEHEEL